MVVNITSDELSSDSYVKQLYSIDIKKMTLASILLFVISGAIMIGTQILLNNTKLFAWYYIILTLALCYVAFLVHELLHALAFIIFAKAKPSTISFGGSFKEGMLYCTSSQPTNKYGYLIAILTPTIVTLIGCVFATIFGNIIISLCMAILLSGCVGDICMANQIVKLDKSAMILDHPLAPAFYAIYKKGQQPKDFVEVTQEQEDKVLVELNKYKQANSKPKNWVWIMVGGLVFGVVLGIILVVVLG